MVMLASYDDFSIKVDKMDAKHGSEYNIFMKDRLKAISDLQIQLSVADQGKDTGMLTISLTGEDPSIIERIVEY